MADKVPRLLPGVDIRKFKLDPMDGFLLTRVDGKLGPKDLARETGLPDFSVARTLEKLEKLGIVEIIDPSAPPPPPPAPPAERKSTIAQFEDGLLAPKYDPKELEAPADLSLEQKKRILDFFHRLDDLDHYTLLGVTQEATKKEVKRAYFELAAAFHPDRFFKKDLGTFKSKMEILFARVTEAHDTLVDATKRAEYDAYLGEVATTRGMEAMLERAMAESARAIEAEKERLAAAAAAAPPSAPPAAPSAAPPPTSAPPSGPSSDETRRRREVLARRLIGGSARPPHVASSSPAPPPSTSTRPDPLRYGSPQDAMDALKRRYEQRIETATQIQTQKYVTEADDALARNDVVAASSSLRIAVRFAPEDAALAARAAKVKKLADAVLSESYLKQAEYEERALQWDDAAKSWANVAKIRDDAVSHERAAHAMLRSSSPDLRVAADHAKRAITLDPSRIEHHVTLAEIYLEAGLRASARRSADAAAQLDAKHAGLQAFLKKLEKA